MNNKGSSKSLNDEEFEPQIPDLRYLELFYSKKSISSNGQRIFGPIPGSDDELFLKPSKGCEIFVGHISYKVYEDVLFPLFSEAGPIYEMRLMMQFSGFSRGFCFITFYKQASVNIAIKKFHGYKLKGQTICVYKSLDNCRLYISGIPENINKETVLKELDEILNGVTDIQMKRGEKGMNCGFAFVDFETHKQAAEARRLMWPDKLVIGGFSLSIEWARPNKPKYIRDQLKLIVRGLPMNLDRLQFTEFISTKITLETVTNTFKNIGQTFGYLEFSTLKYATKALFILNGARSYFGVIEAERFQLCDNSDEINDDMIPTSEWPFDEDTRFPTKFSQLRNLNPQSYSYCKIKELENNMKEYEMSLDQPFDNEFERYLKPKRLLLDSTSTCNNEKDRGQPYGNEFEKCYLEPKGLLLNSSSTCNNDILKMDPNQPLGTEFEKCYLESKRLLNSASSCNENVFQMDLDQPLGNQIEKCYLESKRLLNLASSCNENVFQMDLNQPLGNEIEKCYLESKRLLNSASSCNENAFQMDLDQHQPLGNEFEKSYFEPKRLLLHSTSTRNNDIFQMDLNQPLGNEIEKCYLESKRLLNSASSCNENVFQMDLDQPLGNEFEKCSLHPKGLFSSTSSYNDENDFKTPKVVDEIHPYFVQEPCDTNVATGNLRPVYLHSFIDPCLETLGYNDLFRRLIYLVKLRESSLEQRKKQERENIFLSDFLNCKRNFYRRRY